MKFEDQFEPYVCEGDSIQCTVGIYTVTAKIIRDVCLDTPDKREEGFWPSLYKGDPGFIGPGKGFRRRFDEAQQRAKEVMRAWKADEWFYCGVVLSVSVGEFELSKAATSLWGVEANYPSSDNAYLTEIANELLSEALNFATAKHKRLCALLRQEVAV